MPIALRTGFNAASAKKAARIGWVTLQLFRDWVMKFTAARPDGLIARWAPEQPSILNATHRPALIEDIERGAISDVHPVVRWRIDDPAQMS